jgi:hypothetical protein
MKKVLNAFDLFIVIMGLVVGFGVWFIPNFRNSQVYKDFVARQDELQAIRLKQEALEAKADAVAKEMAKEREELGIVYYTMPEAPKPAPSPAPAPQKN